MQSLLKFLALWEKTKTGLIIQDYVISLCYSIVSKAIYCTCSKHTDPPT